MLRPPAQGGVLPRFTRDLTAEARAGRLDPIRCRAPEIDRLVDILLRHGKNNPALVGPAGVGKTAIVEGLAERTAQGRVPFALRGVRILSLDHVSLLAGTTYRGQYEERLRAIVAECSASDDVVLFIDELHNLIGQGTAMGTAMDAGNMLKPALTRGDFRVIGATTDDEYERWVCGDPALERRFQKITVRELSAAETMEILRARQSTLERHHGVIIADEALDAALRLTDLHVTDRMRPDRALDVLDEACAHAQAKARYGPETERLVLERRNLLRDGADAPERRAEAPPAGARRASAADGPPAPGTGTRTPPEGTPGAARPDRNTSGSSTPGGRPGDSDGADADLPLDRIARDGMAALGRFGAELEAMFAVPAGGEATGSVATKTRGDAPARTVTATDRGRLAELDTELARRLMEEGLVVRGHDVARVVAIATGETVRWKG